MTDDDTKLLASLTGFTPGTWELDPVKGDWMGGFYSGETPVCTFGDAQDYYPTEGEPPNYANAQLIAAAPDLHRIATELAAENKRLRVENSGLSQMLAGQRIDLAQARAEMGDTTMKNAHNITDRFTGSVIFTAEIQVADDAPMALRLGAATAVAVAAKADLSGADLRHADLSGADLSEADLSEADLSGADLSEAYLNYADLSGADLRHADLSGADLRHADLSGADLSEADLSGADMRGADLSSAKS